MIELDEIKVWVFYLKSNPSEIYAYTSVKKYKDQFLAIRNPNIFHIEKLILDELEFSIFANKYRNQMLSACPLGCGLDYKDYVNVIMTTDEEIKLNEYANRIDHQMEDLYRSILNEANGKLKKRYREAADYLLNTLFEVKLPGNGIQATSRMNLLFLFGVVFKDTLRKGM